MARTLWLGHILWLHRGEQSSPALNLAEGTTPMPTPYGDPNYHFNTDMTDKAIAWEVRHDAMKVLLACLRILH